jgi:RHH-type transcriptional regulator, proline utilization regulon repressor / proline dehydrogenase / delta 1-pyrroline-5-carboxylate dehydrogenase
MTGPNEAGSGRQWVFDAAHPALAAVDAAIERHYLTDESAAVKQLVSDAQIAPDRSSRALGRARALVSAIRQQQARSGGLDALLGEYDLSSAEGIVLMCLAEALLRIPDSVTADRLIADKLGSANWETHVGASESLFVNASTWALLLTGRLVRPADVAEPVAPFLKRLVERLGDSVVRSALRAAMRVMGQQFVMGETIESALSRAARAPEYDYSFDMLGEAALTAADAERYFAAYIDAIDAIGRRARTTGGLGISVKLSALCPRYEASHGARAVTELTERLLALAQRTRHAAIGLTVDAEEADRLMPSLAVFQRVYGARALADYDGLGLAVQAYQKRAPYVLEWLEKLARSTGPTRQIPVRLVKGAYWDSEIKHAQEQGLAGYPVFTLKTNTDVSYLACAKALLLEHPHLYPQFATHNAHTVAWILEVGADRKFEFQRLHGMGEELYSELMTTGDLGHRCRVYAPVGTYEHLLPYLVRRLLENGANTSFVNRLAHAEAPIETIVADPIDAVRAATVHTHANIPLPRQLFAPDRANSHGWNLADSAELAKLRAALDKTAPGTWSAAPRISGQHATGDKRECRDPADRRRTVGTVEFARESAALDAVDAASDGLPRWSKTPPRHRAELLRRTAELFENDTAELAARCVAEAGKSLADSLAEVREAVDLLRYYAAECERLFSRPSVLPGPTGERNELRLTARGVFVCISPWNFPAAIFTGQVAAALAAGNTVVAKPAEQASLVASHAVELMQRAGIPADALQFLPGDGATLGERLLADARVAGVAFTGSVETAAAINRRLAHRDGPLATLIAETGGVNAMIVDSSALPEQVVRDAAQSAFNSAGQRCSALRLLCLQEEAAPEVLRLLCGWLEELDIGDPALLATDVGPVIDEEARAKLEEYVAAHHSRLIRRGSLDESHAHGLYVPPTLIELDRAADLKTEVFGPVLHVVRYPAERVMDTIDEINCNGYGLTLGIHTRIDAFARSVADRARVGNVYVNRNMIGAQVGVQPFGGMGLSGTGPKAGGPSYVARFAVEQTVTTNTAAVGGNATLLSLDAETIVTRGAAQHN